MPKMFLIKSEPYLRSHLHTLIFRYEYKIAECEIIDSKENQEK